MHRTGRNALLVAFGFPVQYRALRCATMAGFNVHLLAAEEAGGLRYSRYCQSFTLVPGMQGRQEEELPELERAIKEAVARYDIEIVLPADRDAIWCLSQLKDRLGVPVFPVPEVNAFNRIDDKWTFRDLCMELGVPTPRSWIFETDEELLAFAKLGELPDQLIVKPTRLSGEAGVVKVARWNLAERLKTIEYRPLLVQEFIPGVDYHCTIVSVKGDGHAALTYVDRPEAKYFGCEADIRTYAEQIISHLKLDGIFNFDSRRTPEGKIYFLECNPRPFMSMHMCAQAGINCFEVGIRAMKGTADAPIIMDVKSLKKWRGLMGGLLQPWKLSRGDWGRLFDTLRDPVPALYEVSEHLSNRGAAKVPSAGLKRFLSSATKTALSSAGNAVRLLFGPARRVRIAK